MQLFALPEYESAVGLTFDEAIGARVKANSPLLSLLAGEANEPVRTALLTRGDGHTLRIEPMRATATIETDVRNLAGGDLSELRLALDHAATEQAQRLTTYLVDGLRRMTDFTGNVVRANGRALTHGLVMDLIERTEFELDAFGRPQFVLAAGGAVREALLSLPPMTRVEEARWGAIMGAKHRDARARRPLRRR
jgi:hypothetical protein